MIMYLKKLVHHIMIMEKGMFLLLQELINQVLVKQHFIVVT